MRAALFWMVLCLGWQGVLAQEPRRPAAAEGAASAAPAQAAHAPGLPFRGVFFNPKVTTGDPSYSWLSFYPRHRVQVQAALRDLVREARINLVDIFVSIPYSLKEPARTPPSDRPFEEWANLDYLDQAAAFVDDCWAAGVAVEIDLASNMWVPYSADPGHQIANSGHWPMPGETPWEASAAWYGGAIRHVEGRAAHPEAIALWCMMGNYDGDAPIAGLLQGTDGNCYGTTAVYGAYGNGTVFQLIPGGVLTSSQLARCGRPCRCRVANTHRVDV